MEEDISKIQRDNHLELLPLVLDSIKKIARSYKINSHTLQTTEIVHEGYLSLVKEGSKKWADENAFLAAYAITMRRFLVDRYRKKTAQKRGGQDHDIYLDDLAIEFPAPDGFQDWLELDRLIDQMEAIDPLVSQVVQLKYFVGLSTEEIAKVIKKNPRTVSRKWHFARAWLNSKLSQ